MWPRDLSHWICLADDEKVLDLSQEILRIALDSVSTDLSCKSPFDGLGGGFEPHNQEICMVWLMSEERCSNEIVV